MTAVTVNDQAIPGPSRIGTLKHLPRLLSNPLKYFEDMVCRYGRIHWAWLGTKMVLLHDAELISQVLSNDGLYVKARPPMDASRPLLGDSVATVVDIAEWTRLRQHVLPLFTPRMLEKYYAAMVRSIGHELKTLDRIAAQGRAIDLSDFMHQATFRVLSSTIFSRGIESSEVPQIVHWFDQQTAYISARYFTNSSPLIFLLPGVLAGKRALDKLDRMVDRLIDARLAEGRTEAEDMLDVLMLAKDADGQKFPRKAIRDNAMTMLFGGHETTAGSTSWAFGLLAKNQDQYRLMLEEVDRILAGSDTPSMDQYRALEYVEMVFEEAMRLYPMFAYLGRSPARDTELGGYPLKAGTPIGFVAWTTQRDPRYWPDPERFIPERHRPEAAKGRPKCAYLPFSHGQRRCIGERVARMEGVLLLSMICQRFRITLATPDGELPKTKVSMSIKPRGGMLVRVERRS